MAGTGITQLKSMTSSTEAPTKSNIQNLNTFGVSYDEAVSLINASKLPTYYSGSGTYTVSFDSTIVHQFHRLASSTTATIFNSATSTGLLQGYLIEIKNRSTSGTVTVNLSGSDTFDDTTTTKSISANAILRLRYAGSNIWDVV
jgi:hypothetical protein